jgi:CRP-like cAMP-binding protein
MENLKMNALTLFQQVPLFAGLEAETIEFLAQVSQPLQIKGGEFVVREGTPGNTMYLVAGGEVEVVKRAGTGEEVVLACLRTNDFFGEMSIVEVVNRSASVRALGGTELFALKNSDLHHLYQKWPKEYAVLILNLARDLSRRLRKLDEHFAARAH